MPVGVLDRVPSEEEETSGETMALRTSDRCDRCSAQALYHAIKGDQDLLFCGHHGNRHMDALVMSGWEVLDERDGLYQAPIPGSLLPLPAGFDA